MHKHNLLIASVPLPKPSDGDDARLLEELMNGPRDEGETSEFAAQWHQLMTSSGKQETITNEYYYAHLGAPPAAADILDGEFGGFVASKANNALSLPSNNAPSSSSSKGEGGFFLPSQLFESDQSFHAKSGQGGGQEGDLLRDFPMPSPSRPAAVQKQVDKERKAQQEQKGGRVICVKE